LSERNLREEGFVICPTCQTTNAADANFCLSCGQRIALICPRCGRRVLSHARFCDACGQALLVREPAATGPAAQPELPGDRAPATPQTFAQARAPEPEVPAPQSGEPRQAGIASPPPAGAPPLEGPRPTVDASQAAVEATRTTGGETERRGRSGDSPLGQYIPKALLQKLEAARSSGDMIGERRVVTMLFCDVKGSTAAAEKLDPEEWSEIINTAFEHMIRPVYTYEGTVARLMGDGILAFFGAPLAHEDDPQRAVLAGLDIVTAIVPYRERIKQEWGIELDVRVGINTGLVVVGAVGSDLRMEYTALGDAINLAARMEQTAAPGTVQIAYDT
jgi:class 3 adenylate cyclase